MSADSINNGRSEANEGAKDCGLPNDLGDHRPRRKLATETTIEEAASLCIHVKSRALRKFTHPVRYYFRMQHQVFPVRRVTP
jgi:hypothetical protein